MRSLRLEELRGPGDSAAGGAGSIVTGNPALDRIGLWFDAVLDDSYSMIRGVELPGALAPIDIVVIGPPGIWALYVECEPGQYKVEGGDFYAWDSQTGVYLPTTPNPVKQIRYNEAQLRGRLNATGLPRDCVRSVILFTDLAADVEAASADVSLIGAQGIEAYPVEIARQTAVLDEAAIQRALTAIARADLPPPPAPPREPPTEDLKRRGSRGPGLQPRQWAVLGLLALLDILTLGGLAALVFLNR